MQRAPVLKLQLPTPRNSVELLLATASNNTWPVNRSGFREIPALSRRSASAPADKAMPFFRSEMARYAKLVKKAGVELQ